MKVSTVVINKLFLTRQCEAWFWGENAAVPVVSGSVAVVAEGIRERGVDVIEVRANLTSNPKFNIQDRKTFNRRLQKLAAESGYVADEFVGESGFITSTMRRAD